MPLTKRRKGKKEIAMTGMTNEQALDEIKSLLEYGRSEYKADPENEQLFIPDTLKALKMAQKALQKEIKYDKHKR
jgi:hypothetical protein